MASSIDFSLTVTNHSIEDVHNQFRTLNDQFNSFMSVQNYNYKDGKVITILKQMLSMVNREKGMIHVESIVNAELLLSNLHKALTGLEEFRVIYEPAQIQLELGDEYANLYYFLTTEGVTNGYITSSPPTDSFDDLVDRKEPKITVNHEQKLVFYIEGREQDSKLSPYQALLCHKWRKNKDFDVFEEIWNVVGDHEIKYERVNSNYREFNEDLSVMEKESQIVLHLLRTLHNFGIGCPTAFVNQGLDEKMIKQMDDEVGRLSPLCLPPWWIHLMLSYPFLFSYQTRGVFFKMAAYFHIQPNVSQTMADGELQETDTYVVSRNQIMNDAKLVMDHHAGRHKNLIVHFDGELGVDIGPTKEFYTLISNEFQKCGLMWRKDKSFGLFPRPLFGSSVEEIKTKFVLLGQVVGKAIENGRLLDIHFSKAFYKLILGKELTICDIQSFEPNLGRTLLQLQEYKDGPIEDLSLCFVYPGYEEFMLEDKDVPVDSTNLKDYISFLNDATIGNEILVQLEAFREGFNQVFSRGAYPTGIQTCSVFTVEEFEAILCGQEEQNNSWSLEELKAHIDIVDGYTADSDAILNLLEILQEFDLEQKRGFLQFVTGTPRLPSGGLGSLVGMAK